MVLDPHDQEVIRLLARLKEADSEYPQELLATRRLRYLRRMGEIELGIGNRVEASQVTESITPQAPPTVSSALLETVLVVAILAEAGAVAYLNRGKLADLLQTITSQPEVQEIISPPETVTSAAPGIVSQSPVATPTVLSPTISSSPTEVIVTHTGTPSPESLAVTLTVVGPNSGEPTRVDSTPVPNGNNGNHYGQTPRPERTKENNGNNDNKPPRD
jgi:hypothetical protein